MQPNIIFDVGNVLIKWDPNPVYTAYFSGDADKVTKFYTETEIFKWNEQIDAGAPINSVIEKLAEKFPNYREPITYWHTKWQDMIGGEITDSVTILQSLHAQNIPLFALTNWSHETFFQHIRYQYSFFELFNDIVVSGLEKVIKPDVRIYEILLERNKLHPQNCLFIDDNANNLVPAQKLGMDVIRFESSLQLHRELLQRKILR